MSRFKVGGIAWTGRGKYLKNLVVAKVIDNPMLPVYQYSFEAPNDGFACGEQSLRETADGPDLTIRECLKENYKNENKVRVNTIASALRQVVSEESSGMFENPPKLSMFDEVRVDFKPDIKLVKWLVAHANGRMIIHVGSGQGHLVNMLKCQGGGRAIGIEPHFNKEKWIQFRLMRDSIEGIDINEILEGEIQDYAKLLTDIGKDKAMVIIARPKVKDFVEETVELMPDGMELVYMTTDKIRSVKTDYCFYEATSIEQLKNEGCSEDDELIYSIIK